MLNGIGYRPLFDVNVTAANIYNFLGQFEEGQGIMLEDEMDNIEEQDDKMRIYKTGYVSGAQVTRMYDSTAMEIKEKDNKDIILFALKHSLQRDNQITRQKDFQKEYFL